MLNQTDDPGLTKEAVIERLKLYSITPTQQRIDIAQIMFERPQHLSAEQVLTRVNQTTATVSKATVYNTLGLFAKKELVREVIVDPTKVFYDSNTSRHHHFYNLDTGLLTDIYSESIDLFQLPELPTGTKLFDVDVIIRIRNL